MEVRASRVFHAHSLQALRIEFDLDDLSGLRQHLHLVHPAASTAVLALERHSRGEPVGLYVDARAGQVLREERDD